MRRPRRARDREANDRHQRWRPARARILDDDDPEARLDTFSRRAHEASVRRFGTDLLTIQFEWAAPPR